ncbi:MAG: SDR family NAD(P)-dependent oxidoreductase, partial [Geminicoccaceae bacterium]|nr:SDR family NAD(P)-dependent oxidoreductase [Geminicoccaceae bacterium]
MSRNSIEGKVVLITGGAKNLGGLLAREFAGAGAKAVAIHYNSDSARGEADATVAAIRKTGAEAAAFQADLTSAGAM